MQRDHGLLRQADKKLQVAVLERLAPVRHIAIAPSYSEGEVVTDRNAERVQQGEGNT
jgi:hypothetical protein